MLLPVRPKAKCKLENIIKSEPDEITQTTETTRSTNHQETTSSGTKEVINSDKK